jgi:hypothetical protein
MKATVLSILIFTMASSAFGTESSTMMCNNGIVSIGDTSGEVVSKCGQPTSTNKRDEKKVEGPKGDRTITTNTIDDWTYNFGPYQFQYQLTLRNGRVAKIQSLDVGY